MSNPNPTPINPNSPSNNPGKNPGDTNTPQNFTAYDKAQADSYTASRRDYHPTLYNAVINYHFNNKPPNLNPNPNLLPSENHNHNPNNNNYNPNNNKSKKYKRNITTLLDVGCGTGFAARALAPHFSRTIAIDPSEGMLQSAARGGFPFPDNNNNSSNNVIYACSTAGELGINLSRSVFGVGDDGDGDDGDDGDGIGIGNESVDLLVAASAAHHWLSPSRSSSSSPSRDIINDNHHHNKRDDEVDEKDEVGEKDEKEEKHEKDEKRKNEKNHHRKKEGEKEGEKEKEAQKFWTRAAQILKPNGTVALWAASTILIPSSTPNHEALQCVLDEGLYGFLADEEEGMVSEKDRVVWRGYRGLILPFSFDSLSDSSLGSSLGGSLSDGLSGSLSSSPLNSGLVLPLSSGGMSSAGTTSTEMGVVTGTHNTEDDDVDSSFLGAFDESSFMRIDFGNAGSSKARDGNRDDDDTKTNEKKPDGSTWTLPGNEFYNVSQSDSFTLAQLEKILGMATPVVRWRAAHPDLCNTEEDIVKKTIRQMEKTLREVGADVDGPVWDGSVRGVLLMFKKKGNQEGLNVSLSSVPQ